jgi:3-oxoacyl-[acyl-carrier protein] reductase
MAVVVTGATRGLGLGVTKYLLSKNYQVACIGQNPNNLLKLKETLNVPTYQCNVGDYESVKQTVAEIGPIAGLVNCAGISNPRLLMRDTIDNMQHIININLMGTIYMTKEVTNYMIRKKIKGSIVNVSSLLAKGSQGSGNCAYSTSKAGVEGFSLSLSVEL